MSDQFILGRYVQAHPDMVDLLSGHPFSVLPIAWAVAKENSGLLAELNALLSTIIQSDAYKALQARYTTIPFAPLPDNWR